MRTRTVIFSKISHDNIPLDSNDICYEPAFVMEKSSGIKELHIPNNVSSRKSNVLTGIDNLLINNC